MIKSCLCGARDKECCWRDRNILTDVIVGYTHVYICQKLIELYTLKP